MKFPKIIALLLFIMSCSIAEAQKMELGKVTIEELQQKSYPADSSAPAAILFKTGETVFEYSESKGFVMNTKVQVKIKIYKKEGYEWANQKVSYYLINDSKESVSFSNAITYNLADGKIVKSKLKSDGEFDEKINKYWGIKKITMPNVKEGSIIEFEYLIVSPNYGTLPDWDFQSSIPVAYSEFKTYIPEYFIYNPSIKGYIFPKTSVSKQNKSIVLNSKERSGILVSKTTFSQDKIDYMETKTVYVAQNLPALKEESYVNNINNYISSIAHELSIVKFPNSAIKTYSTDWETVTKTIYLNDDFGSELNKTGYFEDDITKLLVGMNAPEQRIAAIFNYVKENIRWNDFTGYSCNDGVRTAYKTKTGNVAEINLMLTAMLRFAGVTANPVLLSTRSNGISLFPNRNAFNYVIAAVEIKGGLILLDATDKYAVPNILPLRDLNWYGRLIRKDGTSAEVNLMPETLSKQTINMLYSVSNTGEVTGKLRRQIGDHVALAFRQNHLGTSTDNYLEELENENNKIEISDYKRENDTDLSKPIVETYSFKSTNDIEVIGDKIYILPELFFNMSTNPFKQEKREYPVDFGYPTEVKYNINIDVPAGYTVETLPAPINLVTEDQLGVFKYVTAMAGNKIQVSATTTINSAIVSTQYYETLKNFFQKMIEKHNEKIILKKI